MNRKTALSRIKTEAASYGTQANAAEAWGVKPNYLSEVINDKRKTVALPEYLLKKVGLEAVVKTTVSYREVKA